MTDVFNIDLEAEGFRKNNLDWRKFRENYNRVSAFKVERGIKPLPLSLLLKLFGPQKLLNTYVVTRRETNELDDTSDSQIEMRADDIDRTVTKTLNFPGDGVFRNPSGDGHHAFKKSTVSSKSCKHAALPPRPAFQRNTHVPGRYFPKPTPVDEYMNLSISYGENVWDNRQRTQTPRAVNVYTPGITSTKGTSKNNATTINSVVSSRNSKVAKGSVCKSTDTLSAHSSSRPPTMSGKSTATIRSIPTVCSNEYIQSRKGQSMSDRMDVYSRSDTVSISLRTEDRESSTGNGMFEPQNEFPNDINIVKRMKLSTRQVSFPKTSGGFITVLQGRPKTLHRREMTEAFEAQSREPRARTHVGFVDHENI